MIVNNIYFQICSFFYMVMLLIIYFSKKRLITFENKIYIYMMVSNIIGLLLDVFSIYTIINIDKLYVLNYVVSRLYLIYLVFWGTMFTTYIFSICIRGKTDYGKIESKQKRIFSVFLAFFFIISAAILILPIEYYNKNNHIYSYGLGVTLTYMVGVIYVIVCIYISLKNIKGMKKIKCLPLVVYIIIFPILLALQLFYPQLLIVTSIQSFITFLMYFTTSNPDIETIEELNIAKIEAQKASTLKDEFFASMSHEIRTPLNAITGFSQALSLEEGIKEKAREDINDILVASTSLLEIINSILDISNIESNNLEIIKKEYEPEKVINEIILLANARIGSKPVEFKVNISNNLPTILYGDYVRIKQIVLNLLINAAKYTDKGYIEFTVDTIVRDGVCRLIFIVEDTGCGIEKEKLDNIFTKYTKPEVNKSFEGTGLGLVISKKLLDLMGGTIVCSSEYGKGSKFIVALDQLIVGGKDTLEYNDDIELLDGYSKSKRILIVDDNELNLKVASRLLENYNFVIDLVSSGEECINKIKEGIVYDLVLLDDMMPNMNGVETLKKLKEFEKYNTPTIALTANALNGMREYYLSNGFDDYISKPIDKNELDKILNRYL
ncbi:MAG: response regulator [Bacilli bacterium]|nr:response regulator [Bacilli bacterium]